MSSQNTITPHLKTEEGITNRSRSPSPATKKSVIESRRAEQNRAAQRAFRQRKERYVKDLEARVNAMADWPARMEQLEAENEQLKRKIKYLQEENERNRKLLKLEYNDVLDENNDTLNKNNTTDYSSSSSSSTVMNTTTSTSTTSMTTAPTAPTTTTTTATEQHQQGRVLDDLVSILRTRHRPPISSHPPN
ncbi:uncharacterized protein BX663DRAFT_489890 [Cokeromyces recurvatus]|uniref:uncharacterized protein n=1 Tax=Cokeromyces recurvatus TaxID=90255 RepID=UPI002220430F|nr:uncharacterized protein BX663DRAFT_489890 [Cokeromyces recurvatus]KAI7898622.1 hypothetical protein BX663DRAFT_489890 [Cokeromyces recurvatus]